MAIPEELFRAEAEYAWLSPEEMTVTESMGSRKRRAQFSAGRLLLRHALRRSFGPCADAWRVRTTGGVPRVEANFRGQRLVCSLSHSGALALCGVAAGGDLGVDIEQCVPRRSGWAEFAAHALHPLERERLAGLAEPARWRALYQAWTLKEALSKALGVGLRLPFDRVSFSRRCRIEAAPDEFGVNSPDWRCSVLDAGGSAVAAMAWRAAKSA